MPSNPPYDDDWSGESRNLETGELRERSAMDSKQEIPEDNFRNTMDAKLWAEGFMSRFEHRKDEIDEGLMISWFANAIMAGYDHSQSQLTSAREQIEALNGQLLDKQKLYTDAILRGDALEALQLELDMQNATLSMAVARLGGIVEGNPTGKHNFLQRIDELVAQEGRYRYWLWANHGHSGPALYGDDGEMQCKYCPIVDYKRAEIGELEDQATVARGVNLAQRWAIEAEKASERNALKAQVEQLQRQVAEMSKPVTDEEWETYCFTVGDDSTWVIARQDFDAVLASRARTNNNPKE